MRPLPRVTLATASLPSTMSPRKSWCRHRWHRRLTDVFDAIFSYQLAAVNTGVIHANCDNLQVYEVRRLTTLCTPGSDTESHIGHLPGYRWPRLQDHLRRAVWGYMCGDRGRVQYFTEHAPDKQPRFGPDLHGHLPWRGESYACLHEELLLILSTGSLCL